MPYNERAADRPERFEPGSLIREKNTWLDLDHDPARVVAWEGANLTLQDGPESLRMRAELPSIPVAEIALQSVREGSRRGLSVEFRAIDERMEAGERIISRALLHGIGIVRAVPMRALRLKSGNASRPGLGFPARRRSGRNCRAGAGPAATESGSSRTPSMPRSPKPPKASGTSRLFSPARSTVRLLPSRKARCSLSASATSCALPLTVSRTPVPWWISSRLWRLRDSSCAHTSRRSKRVHDLGRRAGRARHLHGSDLRGIEIAPLTGPMEGLEEIEIGDVPEQRRFAWL